jgi:MoaA/NifB/PqqE/SkfB family radical SAM enzyme
MTTPYCLGPWVNIHVNHLLEIKPCCSWPSNFQSIENYLSGNDFKLTELKQQLVDHQLPQPCIGCSERDWYSEFEYPEAGEFSIKSVDVRWASTCQLNCVYCNAGQSSSWSQLISREKVIPIAPSRIRDVESVFDLFAKSKISRVSMLGGEPLLIKENIRLLDTIDKDTGIEIFTNLNVDLESNKIYQQLINRPNVNWYVSMETIGTKFEFVRRNAVWKKQVQNLEKLIKTKPKSISLQSQYCVYSAFDLIDLYEFASRFDRLHVNMIGENFHPKVLDVFSYPQKFKQLALEELNRCMKLFPNSIHALLPINEKLLSEMDVVIPNIVEDCVLWHNSQETKFFNNQFNFTELWTQFDEKSVDVQD